jgi:glycosyltransferase involved in cell wall biosynthesis
MDDRPYLSMALLAYNERDSIESAAHRSSHALARCGRSYELILVDDGSTDGTGRVMDRLAAELPSCRVIHHSSHLGLGSGIRTAYFSGRGEWATWFPADLQADPADLSNLVERLEQCDVLVTYRQALQRHASLARKVISLLDRVLVRFLFGLQLRDLHWVRFFRRPLLEQMFLKSASPSIDTEMMIEARRLGARILELPLADHPRKAGKAKGARWANILTSMSDLLVLWCRDRFMRVPEWSPRVKQHAMDATEERGPRSGVEARDGACVNRRGDGDHSVLSVAACRATAKVVVPRDRAAQGV